MALGLEQVLNPFKNLFLTTTHPVSQKPFSYLRGLFKSEKNRANCTAISDSLRELDHQSLNHLFTESPRSHSKVPEALSLKAGELFKEDQEVALLIDEVGFRKKGKHSACVGRHYCPVDRRLFMPESREDDHYRRKKAKILDYIVDP